ncbi:MAG TPA: CocE/NonD family hydrolase, partial [Gemmatimonadaceae bacterium]|nr:CocE/NonD family hydrolase [Gemmatimonadaceae bacterium]
APALNAQGRGGPTGPAPVSGIGANGKLAPVVKDGVMQPVIEFADSAQIIRQSLWVETNFDTDKDGKLDRVHVQVTRPGAAEKAGLKIPSLMLSSPYIGPTNGNAADWDVHQELGAPSPKRTIPEFRAFSESMPLKQGPTNWVARGFAAVTVENSGTGLSSGCPTVGDGIENITPKFAIDWLNGRAKGFTSLDGNEQVSAASWSNGKVGMTGTSYEGTMPLAASVTGVPGLEAIIPISPNTSQYRYYRSNGLVRSPGGYLGEDIDELYDFIHSGRVRAECDRIWRDGIFAQNMDRQSGDFNQFWADRDQTPLVKNIRAAVLFAHGFNDWNVMPEHTIRMWDALKKQNPSAKLYMHQGGHGGGPPAEIVEKWWAHYLYGVNNGVDTLPRAMIVQSSAVAPAPPPTAPGAGGGRGGGRGATPMPKFFADYPVPGSAPVKVYPAKGGNSVGTLSLSAPAKQGSERLTDDFNVTPAMMALAATSQNRLLYALPAFTDSVHLSGRTVVTLKIAASKPAVNLSVYLVTLPYDSTRIGSAGQVGVVTRGWADPQNHKSLTSDADFVTMAKGEPLKPGQFYTMTFPLQADDQIIPPGQQLAIMIFSSDAGFTLRPAPGSELTIDLDGSSFTLPVVGGVRGLQAAMRAQ